MRIAVIGSGIAGMSAAWLLSQRHHVTVYEQDRRLGGHSNTVEVPGADGGPDGAIAVDTGFIVYNEVNYPNLVQLFRWLGVETKASEMSFAVSIDDGADGDLEYCGSGMAGLFAQRRNLVRPRYWRMLGDILRFYREAPHLLAQQGASDLTLSDYLDRHGYSQAFIDHHLLPMAAAIWSTTVADMRRHPARAFVGFCVNHGLMRVTGRPQWRTVEGGSRAYVRRLTAAYDDSTRIGSKVLSVRRTAAGVDVGDASGRLSRYDHVVIAAHADQALAMLTDPSHDEREVLGAFGYSRNHAVLHRDPALMPRRRRVWSSWNYMSGRGSSGGADVSVTYWMNRLQGLDPRVPLFVTLNPHREPRPDSIIQSLEYDHPMYDLNALSAQRRLGELQGARRTWYCGSYFGAGFHEDGLQAGLAVAEALGGVRRPWADADPPPEWDRSADRRSARAAA